MLVSGMEGLWRGEEYESVYAISGNTVDYFADEMHGQARDMKLTPEGADLGTWAQCARLDCKVSAIMSGGVETWRVAGPGPLSPEFLPKARGDKGWRGWFHVIKGPLN